MGVRVLAPEARTYLGDSLLFWCLTALVLGLALVLGGGRLYGLRSEALVQLMSLPLLGLALWRLMGVPLWPATRWPLVIVAATVALPLIQLVPLPPSVWVHLPGREVAVQSFQAAGLPLAWWPLSLDPHATWRSFLSILPAVAVFLAVITIDHKGRRSLCLVALAIGVIAVAVGFAQLMRGPQSSLYFHEWSNRDHSVGFLANRNHHAAFLYALAPFAAAWAAGLIYDGRKSLSFAITWCGLFFIVLILGVAMTTSRAGAFLGVAALLLSLLIAVKGNRQHGRQGALTAMMVASLLALILVINYALSGLLGRLEQDLIDDYRFEILPIAWNSMRSFLPVGSGFGTFEAVYLMHDRPEALLTAYVNHAHNDWLELLVEGGVLAAALMVAFLVWMVVVSARTWSARAQARSYLDLALARAATISIAMLLLHSHTEFPLRMTAVLTLFAFLCALLVKPPQAARVSASPVRRPSRRGHSRVTPARIG